MYCSRNSDIDIQADSDAPVPLQALHVKPGLPPSADCPGGGFSNPLPPHLAHSSRTFTCFSPIA
jgi:hypothetical protein